MAVNITVDLTKLTVRTFFRVNFKFRTMIQFPCRSVDDAASLMAPPSPGELVKHKSFTQLRSLSKWHQLRLATVSRAFLDDVALDARAKRVAGDGNCILQSAAENHGAHAFHCVPAPTAVCLLRFHSQTRVFTAAVCFCRFWCPSACVHAFVLQS